MFKAEKKSFVKLIELKDIRNFRYNKALKELFQAKSLIEN
jgi:hypothetical protein